MVLWGVQQTKIEEPILALENPKETRAKNWGFETKLKELT